MSKGRLRTPERESGPTEIDPRCYGLDEQLSRVVNAANKSPDAVALITLGKSEEDLEGAIVVLRGHDTVMLFEQWAVRNRVLDPTRPDGLVEALEGSDGRSR